MWWPATWERSLTQVLDPPGLSARPGCERSRRGGRIADAWALTTRLLAWASWWPGSTQAVPWQL